MREKRKREEVEEEMEQSVSSKKSAPTISHQEVASSNVLLPKTPIRSISRLKDATLFQFEKYILIHLPIEPTDVPTSVIQVFQHHAKQFIHPWAIERKLPFTSPFFYIAGIPTAQKVKSNDKVGFAISNENYAILTQYIKAKRPKDEILAAPQMWSEQNISSNSNSHSSTPKPTVKTPILLVPRFLKADYRKDPLRNCYIISIPIDPSRDVAVNVVRSIFRHGTFIEDWWKLHKNLENVSLPAFFKLERTRDKSRKDLIQMIVSLDNYSILYEYLTDKGSLIGETFSGPRPDNISSAKENSEPVSSAPMSLQSQYLPSLTEIFEEPQREVESQNPLPERNFLIYDLQTSKKNSRSPYSFFAPAPLALGAQEPLREEDSLETTNIPT